LPTRAPVGIAQPLLGHANYDTTQQYYNLGPAINLWRNNLDLLRPGMSFRELSERGWGLRERFVKNRYAVMAHGVGMRIGYPKSFNPRIGSIWS
jgi:hypothetical protein